MIIRKTFVVIGAIELLIALLILAGMANNLEVVYKNLPPYKYTVTFTILTSGIILFLFGLKNICVNHKYFYAIVLLSVALVDIGAIIEVELSEVEIISRSIAGLLFLIIGIIGLFLSAREKSKE